MDNHTGPHLVGGLLAVLLEDQLEPGVGHNDEDNVDDDDDDHLLLVRRPKLENGLADLLSYLSLCAKVRRQAGLQLRRLLTVQQVWHQLGNLRSKVEERKKC